MNKMIKYIFLFTGIIFPVILLGQKNDKENFKDMYALEKVYKAEVSFFQQDTYHQIDHTKLLKELGNSKHVFSKFIPYKEVVLHEQGGNIYVIYFSADCQIISIDNSAFSVAKKRAKNIAEILEHK